MEPADRMQLHCHCQESCVERLQQVPGRLLAHRFQLFCAGLREVLNQAGQHDYRAPCFVHPSFDGMLVQFLYADDDVIQCIALTFPEDNPIRFVMQGPEPAGNFAGRTGDYLEPVQWSMWARPMGIVFVEIVHHPALEHHGRAVDHFVSFMCPRPTNLSTARGRAPGALHVRMTGTGTLANRFWPLVQASGLTEPTHTGECARNVARLLQYPVKEFRYTVTLNEIHIESASDENPGGVRLTCANELIPEQLAFAEVAFEEASRTDEQEPLSAVTYRLVLEVLGSTGNLPMLQRQIVNNALQNHLLDDRGVKILNDKAETTLRANVLLPFCTPRTDPGHTVQRGALFHGPPGTAKSTLARCIYEHAGLRPMEIRSAASFASRYLGDTEEMLTTIFKGAHEHPDVPHVMIIEEIEALAETRSSGPDAHHAKWLTHLFSEIDKTKNVLLLCTTNRRAALDPAFTRVGRVSVEIFCGKLNAEKATDLIHSTFTKLGFAALIKEELDHELRENQVLLTNLSGTQVRGLAENVLRGYQEQGLIVRQLTASDIINHLKGALHNLIGSSNDPDLFSFSSGDAGAMFADQKSEQYLLESCENGRLSGRMLHHREHVWVEGQKQAVRELALKEPIKGPAAVYHLALLLQKISRANTATVVDSRRKEFLQHDKSPFDLVVECSENARDRGTVVIVDVDDLAGIMVDQQTQRGSSRQKAEGGMQETTAQSFHVAREHALQNIISFSRSLAQRVQPSGNTFCLCVLSTAHPFILRRLGHGMIFGLPEAPFNPPLYSQLGYEVLDSTGVSKVQRVQSGQDGFIPLVSPLVAKDAEPLLVEVTIHSIKDDLEFGFTSPVNVPSGTLVSSKSAATLTWKEWHLHSRGQSKPLKEKPEQHPDLPQVIFLIQQDSWLAVGWLSKAGAPILSEDLGVDLGGVAHPFISLKTPADTASVKVYGGLGNFPLRYLEAYQNVLAKDRGVLVFALPYSEYSESAMERLPWYEATIPDGVRTIRITACGPGGRGAKGVADQKNGAGGASGAVVDATFSVTAGAKKLCVELGAHLNPKDTNLKPASSTKIYESETGQRDIANVRRDVLLEAGGGGLQDIVGEGFAKTSDFMQLTSAVVKKGNPGEKASPMMTNSWENTPNGGAASWPKEILEMIQRKFPVIDTKNCYGQTRQQRFVPQIGGGGPGGSHNGGGIPGAFTGAPGACVIQFDPPPQATEGN